MKKKYIFLTACLSVSALIYGQSKTAALKFDGTDDHVIIPHDNSLNLGRSAFTIEAWITATGDNVGTSAPMILSKKENGSTSTTGWLFGMDDKGKVAIQLKGDSYGPGFGFGGPGVAAIDLRDGQAHHIAWTREVGGTEDTLNAYQDAAYVKKTRKACGTKNLNGSEDLWIGWSDFNSSPDIYQFAGWIKEIRIWDHAKTESQIFNDRTVHLTGNEPGLIAYWRLNENSGTVAYECVGTNDGVINGATWDNTFKDVLTNSAPAICGTGGIGINEVTSTSQVNFYPNPTLNELNLSVPGSMEFNEVVLYDLNGKVALRTNWEGMHPLNISNLNAGTYMIQLNNAGQIVHKSMISKE